MTDSPLQDENTLPLGPPQKALLGYMRWWSEDTYCAGWLHDLENAMVGDSAYDWLVEQAGGTFTWTDNGEVFVPSGRRPDASAQRP